MLANMASGLSQVPLSITVNVTAVSGTLRVRVPPPPNDRLWLGFIDKPDLSLSFTPSIGEKQLKRFPLATKIVDKVKELINRTLVLPACVDIPLSFMKADPDDWLPRDPRMLPWRPAAVPPYGRGISDAAPISASEAASEITKTVGESEIGWEDEPRQDTIALTSNGLFSTSRRSLRPDTGTPMGSPGGLIPTPSWRGAPRPQASPSRRGLLAPKDHGAPNRSILAAAKTSLQSAAGFVKQPQPQGATAPPLQGQAPPAEASALVTTTSLGTIGSMRAEVRKAASGLFKGRKEQSEAQLIAANISKSLPPVLTAVEPVLSTGEENMGSSRDMSVDWMLDNSLPPVIVSEPHKVSLDGNLENRECRVRRSSSARELEGVDTLSPWKSTPLAAHVSGEVSLVTETPGVEQSLTSGSSSEWHGTDAVKGDMSGRGSFEFPTSGEFSNTSVEDATPLDPQLNSEAQAIKEWQGGDSAALMKRMELPLVAVRPKEIVSLAQGERLEAAGLGPDTEDQDSAVSMALGAEEEGRRSMFGVRKELSESLRVKAKDIAGKLGDREMHAQARQVVGQVMGETKEKAKEKVKKFANFLKEKQATLAGRQAPETDV